MNNNTYVIKEYNGKWYGWETEANKNANDQANKRVLKYQQADMVAPTEEKLRFYLEDAKGRGPENGYTTTQLPKDNTPIEFVDETV